MPAFPLSKFFLEGSLERTPQENVALFQPEVGTPIKRVRYTLGLASMVGSKLLTDDEAETLEDFWRDDCSYGVETFTWTDHNSVSHTYHWNERPQFSRVSRNAWRVSLNLTEVQ